VKIIVKHLTPDLSVKVSLSHFTISEKSDRKMWLTPAIRNIFKFQHSRYFPGKKGPLPIKFDYNFFKLKIHPFIIVLLYIKMLTLMQKMGGSIPRGQAKYLVFYDRYFRNEFTRNLTCI